VHQLDQALSMAKAFALQVCFQVDSAGKVICKLPDDKQILVALRIAGKVL